MFKSWYFRFGAYHLDQALSFELAQLRSHVPIQRLISSRCSSFSSRSTYLASSGQANDKQTVFDATSFNATSGGPQTPTGRLEAIPETSTFESPFGISIS